MCACCYRKIMNMKICVIGYLPVLLSPLSVLLITNSIVSIPCFSSISRSWKIFDSKTRREMRKVKTAGKSKCCVNPLGVWILLFSSPNCYQEHLKNKQNVSGPRPPGITEHVVHYFLNRFGPLGCAEEVLWILGNWTEAAGASWAKSCLPNRVSHTA